jgi:hypothetical protein
MLNVHAVRCGFANREGGYCQPQGAAVYMLNVTARRCGVRLMRLRTGGSGADLIVVWHCFDHAVP